MQSSWTGVCTTVEDNHIGIRKADYDVVLFPAFLDKSLKLDGACERYAPSNGGVGGGGVCGGEYIILYVCKRNVDY